MIPPLKTQIRNYVKNKLLLSRIVGDQVFDDRYGSAIFEEELPAINIVFKDDDRTPIVGSSKCPRVSESSQEFSITLAIKRPTENSGINGNDILDDLSQKIDELFGKDPFLAEDLVDYNAETGEPFLADGLFHSNTAFFAVEDVESSSNFLVNELNFTVWFPISFYENPRLYEFKKYKIDIVKPEDHSFVLLSGEGSIVNE